MPIQSVMIDSREPTWVQQLQFDGVPTAVTMLPAGDLWIATDDNALLVIERKTTNDLLHTLSDDRLFAQITACHGRSPWAYLLISGELQRGRDGKVITDRLTGWDWNAVQGALLTVQELGVNVVFCGGDYDLEAAVIRLANRNRDTVPVGAPRRSRILSESETIITSLPGIGIERLDAIDQVYPVNQVAYMALLALTDPDPEYWDIKGIGSGITQRIRKVLGLPDGKFLQLNTQEEANDEQHSIDSNAM